MIYRSSRPRRRGGLPPFPFPFERKLDLPAHRKATSLLLAKPSASNRGGAGGSRPGRSRTSTDRHGRQGRTTKSGLEPVNSACWSRAPLD